jgi:putative nucleotidyltransferase with HDIG domain
VETTGSSALVRRAEALANALLDDLADRRTHSAAVARTAGELASAVEPADRDVLVAAAWLHDIGYSHRLEVTGFHPLDGAVYLERHGWPARICALVAHHSAARFVAQALGLEDRLDHFPFEQSPVSDALTYADQTTGPQGQPMTLDQRLTEKRARYDPTSAPARVNRAREPYIRAAAARTQSRLAVVAGCAPHCA